ncbi:MAG TPA: hypothetical protein VLV78_04765 [Thermoanaerobaculia bacterium]|nr:hypothetical protein [Thermoanaerobaculia bacterium]
MTETIRVPLSPDEDGYVGRECPSCNLYFKILPRTGVTDQEVAYCPYCQAAHEPSDFLTQDQLNYAKSIALRQLQGQIANQIKSSFREIHTSGPISLHVTMRFEGNDIPIEHYQERSLETEITCEQCTLQYKIYGVFATCPDCATHNSISILRTNFVLLRKQLAEADETRREDILKNSVSVFDAFGRATTEHAYGKKTSFQALDRAEEFLQELGASMRSHVTHEEWEFLNRAFQKRHLLTHNMGVIDDQYLAKANDPDAILGRKIRITTAEVERTIDLLERIALRLTTAAPAPTTHPVARPLKKTNPYHLSGDAQRIAETLFALDTDGMGFQGMHDRELSERLAIDDLPFDAALGELADHRLIENRNGWLSSTHLMPLALPDAINYSPTADDQAVARAAIDANAQVRNADFEKLVDLPVDRLNRAIRRLEGKRALHVAKALGTAPYCFYFVNPTGDTLRYMRNA